MCSALGRRRPSFVTTEPADKNVANFAKLIVDPSRAAICLKRKLRFNFEGGARAAGGRRFVDQSELAAFMPLSLPLSSSFSLPTPSLSLPSSLSLLLSLSLSLHLA